MKRMLAIVLATLCVLLPWAFGGKYVLHISTMIAIMAMLALSMNLMLRIGQLSMAHSAFMGIGAYASALLTMRLGLPAAPALVLSGVIAGVIAMVLGLVFLRIKGVYFVLLTYAFGQIVNLTFQEWTSLFGGNNGLYGIPKFSLFGIRMVSPSSYYLMALVFAVATLLLVHLIHRSDVGAVLNSLEEDEELSRSLGVNALAWRIAVFGLSAALAGMAGSIYAHNIGFLSPSAFSFGLSVDLVVMNVVGGALSPIGPLLGALIIVPLPELLRGVKEYQLLAYGIILIVFLMFFRDGLVGLVSKSPRSIT